MTESNPSGENALPVTFTEDRIPAEGIDDSIAERQCAKLRRLRAQRNNTLVRHNLAALARAAEGTENLIPPILDCVRSYATLGEMCDALRSVYGEYNEPNID